MKVPNSAFRLLPSLFAVTRAHRQRLVSSAPVFFPNIFSYTSSDKEKYCFCGAGMHPRSKRIRSCNVFFYGWLVPVYERLISINYSSGIKSVNELLQNVRLIAQHTPLSIGSWYRVPCGMRHHLVEMTCWQNPILPFHAKKSEIISHS